jgi:transcriptional regulator with XRE-family HTH domain
MNQPELSLKIAELRKAKGTTQEELALNCNLNVRTIQRIETGSRTKSTINNINRHSFSNVL